MDAERASFEVDPAPLVGAPAVIRTVICDAHRVFAEALASLLRRAGHGVVGCAADLGPAARIAAQQQADACLLDMGGLGSARHFGIERAIASAPRTAFIALVATPDPASLRIGIDAGLHGIALKGDDFEEILRVLTTAVSRSGSPPPPVLSRCARAALRTGRRSGHSPARFLTSREHEALARLVRGESTPSMAKAMGVQVSTARTHVDAVLTKLGVHSRLEAVALAVRQGLVEIDEIVEVDVADSWSRVVAG